MGWPPQPQLPPEPEPGSRRPAGPPSKPRPRGWRGREGALVTWALIGVNTGMLGLETALSHNGVAGLLEPSVPALCQLGALNSAAVARAGEYWRLLTVMALHAGLVHWALNSWALYLFGPLLEHLLGKARYLALYLGAGLVGSAASLLFTHTELGVGASGAIFGLLGALVAFSFRRRSDPRIRALLGNLVFILVLNLYLGFNVLHVDNAAHIGGFVGGLAAMALFEAIPARRPAAWSQPLPFGPPPDPPRRRPRPGSPQPRDAALALPYLACALLTAYAVATFPAGSFFTCVGVHA